MRYGKREFAPVSPTTQGENVVFRVISRGQGDADVKFEENELLS